jgi:uracil-DNA glycosylase
MPPPPPPPDKPPEGVAGQSSFLGSDVVESLTEKEERSAAFRKTFIDLLKTGNDWDALIEGEFAKPYFSELLKFLENEYASGETIYPEKGDIINALRLTPYSEARIVILGQDPYHGPGQAHGLAFSVKPGIEIPPSLANIFEEVRRETKTPIPASGDLTGWAKRGMLLLNTTLTVRANQANSHKGRGWEIFTDRIISILNDKKEPVCFLLWGNSAKEKHELITNKNHLVLTTTHPSPFSAHYGFFGCGHFLMANDFVKKHYLKPAKT